MKDDMKLKIKLAATAVIAAFVLSACINVGNTSARITGCGQAITNRSYGEVQASTSGNQWRIKSGTGTWNGSVNVPSGWRDSGYTWNIGGKKVFGDIASGTIVVEERYTGDTASVALYAACP